MVAAASVGQPSAIFGQPQGTFSAGLERLHGNIEKIAVFGWLDVTLNFRWKRPQKAHSKCHGAGRIGARGLLLGHSL